VHHLGDDPRQLVSWVEGVVRWVWPRAAGLLLGVGALIFAFGEMILSTVAPGLDPETAMRIGGLVLGVALVWLGVARWTARPETLAPRSEREALGTVPARAA
jgi:hypothetical protein